MSQLSDTAFQQVRIAGDDLIESMARYAANLAFEKSKLIGKVRGEQVIGDVEAEFQARQKTSVKRAESDCHWAAERIQSFGMLYMCAVERAHETSRDQFIEGDL